jgi:NEDD8-activating enzyme E1 regulatory subunit
LKNLVLPGIGAFTILDNALVSPADAGNNFFLEGQHSIGKKRAQEAVRLLGELNDGVNGHWDTRRLEDVLRGEGGREWIKGFTIIVAHNLEPNSLDRLAGLLWDDETAPPLLVVRSAGFLAEFFIQFREHNGQRAVPTRSTDTDDLSSC